MTTMKEKEIAIPVPWGIIAGKVWGNEQLEPVICLHGIQDNCGSFDRLVPRLPRGFYFICLDLPCHGRSSHFPPGLPLLLFDFVFAVRIVTEHLQLKNFILIGHSLGAQISILYTSIFPEYVKKLVLIDGFLGRPISAPNSMNHMRTRFDRMIAYLNKKTEIPSYTEEEVLHKLLTNRSSQLTEESAKILMKRGVTKTVDGLSFSSDQRLKQTVVPLFTVEQIFAFISNIKCPVLLIIAKNTIFKQKPSLGESYPEALISSLFETIEMSVHTVEGDHDVHINYSERVAPHIVKFLSKEQSKL